MTEKEYMEAITEKVIEFPVSAWGNGFILKNKDNPWNNKVTMEIMHPQANMNWWVKINDIEIYPGSMGEKLRLYYYKIEEYNKQVKTEKHIEELKEIYNLMK